MKPAITPEVLRSLGIVLPKEKEDVLVAVLQQNLEERIGADIIETLTPEKADELNKLAEADDEAVTSKWIVENVPDYAQIIQDAYDILLGEVVNSADSL